MTKALFLLAILCPQIISIRAACESHGDCNTCISNTDWWISCRWCALTNACHSVMSFSDNVCSTDQQVTGSSDKKCSHVSTPPTLAYNSTIAEQMAKFSSLAYTMMEKAAKSKITNAIKTYIGPSYEIVEYITSNCGMPYEDGDCAVDILLSHVDKRIIVAFRGTETNFQLFEEFMGGVAGFLDFPPTGGQVLSYFLIAHNSLYECVKQRVEKLLSSNPSYSIYVTGHSLGGAEAELTTVSLIADGVISSDKIHTYTFGSPRIGGTAFAFAYDRIVANSWRVVNRDDPIPKIVPMDVMFVPYSYHTKREVYYNTLDISPSTSYKLCNGNEDETCSGKDTICITETCVYSHMRYFSSSVPNFMRIKIPQATKWTGDVKEDGNCTRYEF